MNSQLKTITASSHCQWAVRKLYTNMDTNTCYTNFKSQSTQFYFSYLILSTPAW